MKVIAPNTTTEREAEEVGNVRGYYQSLDSSVIVDSPSSYHTRTEFIDDFGSIPTLSGVIEPPSGREDLLLPTMLFHQVANHQCSLFGQVMEIEGQLPSSIICTSRRSRLDSDGDISVHEHVTSSPGLSPRILPSGSFHTQISTEPTS
ncbi:hypothetical protein BYT27DRAFT_7256599 [Phlegmacium glaucopus]|nr:hypothetical protein BYT27DRAFT_7256599 [Phlegmacium glaucopus]